MRNRGACYEPKASTSYGTGRILRSDGCRVDFKEAFVTAGSGGLEAPVGLVSFSRTALDAANYSRLFYIIIYCLLVLPNG
jgi:hypothetical protein